MSIENEHSTQTIKLVYISYIRLTDRVADVWFITEAMGKGLEVEFWDVVSLLREEHSEIHSIYPTYLKVISNYAQLKKKVKSHARSKVVFIILLPLTLRNIRIFSLLSRADGKFVQIQWGLMPTFSTQKKKSRVLKELRNIKISYLKGVLNYKLPVILIKFGLIKRFDIIFVAGELLENQKSIASQIIPIAAPEYEVFKQKELAQWDVSGEDYAVFLDINLPFQSDLVLAKLEPINANTYYKSLDNFFNQFESQFKLKVKIAAHPKTDIENANYEGREISRLKTAELVAGAQVVISHHSTSISYAVLSYKPILFIYTQEMDEFYRNSTVLEIENLASYFGTKAINIDKPRDNPIQIIDVNRHVYDKYCTDFIASPGATQNSISRVFLDHTIGLISDGRGY